MNTSEQKKCSAAVTDCDPQDTGIVGVDIYKMDADGIAIEHWDALLLVGDSKNSAPTLAPNIPRANPNGMFQMAGVFHPRWKEAGWDN